MRQPFKPKGLRRDDETGTASGIQAKRARGLSMQRATLRPPLSRFGFSGNGSR